MTFRPRSFHTLYTSTGKTGIVYHRVITSGHTSSLWPGDNKTVMNVVCICSSPISLKLNAFFSCICSRIQPLRVVYHSVQQEANPNRICLSHISLSPTLPPGEHFADFINSGCPVFLLSCQNLITQVFKRHSNHLIWPSFIQLYNFNSGSTFVFHGEACAFYIIKTVDSDLLLFLTVYHYPGFNHDTALLMFRDLTC